MFNLKKEIKSKKIKIKEAYIGPPSKSKVYQHKS